MRQIDAIIYLRTSDEGGLTEAAFSGMQPSIEIAGDLVACKLFCGNNGSEIKRGEQSMVKVEFPL